MQIAAFGHCHPEGTSELSVLDAAGLQRREIPQIMTTLDIESFHDRVHVHAIR